MHILLLQKWGIIVQFLRGQQVLEISQKRQEPNHIHINHCRIYIAEVNNYFQTAWYCPWLALCSYHLETSWRYQEAKIGAYSKRQFTQSRKMEKSSLYSIIESVSDAATCLLLSAARVIVILLYHWELVIGDRRHSPRTRGTLLLVIGFLEKWVRGMWESADRWKWPRVPPLLLYPLGVSSSI